MVGKLSLWKIYCHFIIFIEGNLVNLFTYLLFTDLGIRDDNHYTTRWISIRSDSFIVDIDELNRSIMDMDIDVLNF